MTFLFYIFSYLWLLNFTNAMSSLIMKAFANEPVESPADSHI